MQRIFDFKLLREAGARRTYKDSIFKYINTNKDKVLSIIDEYGDVTQHTFSQVEDFFIKNHIKKALRKDDVIYIECMPNKVGKCEKYILCNKKINA